MVNKFNNTNKNLYEMTEIVRIISVYKNIELSQLCALFNKSETVVLKIVKNLSKKGRIFYDETLSLISAVREEPEINNELSKALWVLTEFRDKLIFHSASDFPVKIVFFTKSSDICYQIICITLGKESFFNMYFSINKTEQACSCRQIAIVENTAQINLLSIPSIFCFCTIDSKNKVTFYKN